MNLYLSNVGCDAPAAWQGGWDLDGQVTLAMSPSKDGWFNSTATRAETSATNPFRVGVLRIISPTLTPQTITGTLDVVIGVSESNLAANFFWRVHVFVWNATDDTVLGTLLNGYEESAGGGGTEWPTTNTGQALQAAQALTNVVVPNDGKAYRVVAELGYIAFNSVTTSRTGTIRFGSVISNASAELADLTVGSTATSTRAGFLSFSNPLTFVAPTVTNLGASTATALGALPAATTQSIRDSGAAQTVWYSFVAPADGVVGVYGYGDFTPIYAPQAYALAGPLGSLDPVGGAIGTFKARNVPVQFPVAAGVEYFIRFVPTTTGGVVAANPDPAVLTLDVRMFEQPAVLPAAPFLVPDDTEPFPAAVLDPTTGDPLAYILDFPTGESGYNQRANGFILTEDEGDGDLALFQPDGPLPGISVVAAVPLSVSSSLFGGIGGNKSTRFYVGNGSSVNAVDLTGAIVGSWTVVGDAWALTPSLDDTILYYNEQFAPVTIRRWDLINDVPLSDLASLPSPDFFSFRQMLTLADGTILIGGADQTVFIGNYTVWRYSPAGVLLNTYDFTAEPLHGGFNLLNQVFESLNDPTDFWVWLKIFDDPMYVGDADNMRSRFMRVQTDTGTILEQFDADIFETGVYSGVPVLNAPRFGHSNSCPAFQWLIGDSPSCPGERGAPRTDGLPYSPFDPDPCAGTGDRGAPRTGA